jgi:hypothetical protein
LPEWVVVWVDACVSGFSVNPLTQRVSCKHVCPGREGGCLTFNGQLDVLVDTIQVVQELFHLLLSMKPHHKGLNYVAEGPTA